MNCCIDIGNTRIKVGVFDGEKDFAISSFYTPDQIISYLADSTVSKKIENWIFTSTQNSESTRAIVSNIESYTGKPITELDDALKLPFKIDYQSPNTLGKDRICSVAGAQKIFGNTVNALIIDFGTCLTFNFISNQVFRGGGISPGFKMRLDAMHHFTGRLPLIKREDIIPETIYKADSTKSAMIEGCISGICNEVDGKIAHYLLENLEGTVVLTGGDHVFFKSLLKNHTFANPDLTLIGLNQILNLNA